MSFMREAMMAIAPAEPPAKRARIEAEVPEIVQPAPAEDVVMEDATVGEEETGSPVESPEQVKELGLRLWQVIRNAEAKDGRELALAFIRQPPRRDYPDYYEMIQHPIALEDVQQNLESGLYTSFKSVKRDLELCFNNARQYNLEDSGIYKDAKHLSKLVGKEYAKLGGAVEGEDGKVKKPKVPSLQRQMKSRLQKLIDKTDETGRILSSEFMDLPPKKDWPDYYVLISKPMSFDVISKKVKKKEYGSSGQFAADVELVFANAMQFNAENSGIYYDALALKDHFARIMADIPPEFALPQYTKAPKAPVKIKIKMPGPAPVPSYAPPTFTQPSYVPGPIASTYKTSPAPAPMHPTAAAAIPPPPAVASLPKTEPAPVRMPAPPKPSAFSLPSAHSISVHQKASVSGPSNHMASAAVIPNLPLPPVPTPKVAPAPKPAKKQQGPPPQPAQHQYTPTPMQQPFAQPSFNYNNQYINAAYKAAPVLQLAPRYAAPVVQAPPPQIVIPVVPKAASAPVHPRQQLRSVDVVSEPLGRRIPLKYEDGVKSWAVRLGTGERSLRISGIDYLGDEAGESSGEDEEEDVDEDDDGDDEYGKKGKPKPKGKKRGRPPKARGSEAPQSERNFKKRNRVRAVRVPHDVSVILNGVTVAVKEARTVEWVVDIPAGSSVVEIGQKGVLLWKIFAQRTA